MRQYDIAIVGAGMVGLSLASKLQSSGLKIAVIDPKRVELEFDSDYDLRVSAITRATENFLKNISAWNAIHEKERSAYRSMQVWDGESTSGNIEFNAKSIAEKELGFIIENRVLRRAIFQSVQGSTDIDFIFDEKCLAVSYQDNHARLDLESGSCIKANLLVAADGAFSWLREASDIGITQKPYGHKAIVATIKTENPHDQIAYQRFAHKGPLAFLPLHDKNYCSIVWSVEEAYADELLGLDDGQFIKRLEVSFENSLGALQLQSKRLAFPLYERSAESTIAHRLALIGDAAHTIHPLAGQGVNLGFADALELANTILRIKQKNKDIGIISSLRPYQRNRASELLKMKTAMVAFKTLFEQKQPFIQSVRAFGLNSLNKLPILKKQIIRQAMGL